MKLSSAAAILLAAAPAAVLAFVVPPQRTAIRQNIMSSSSYAFAPKFQSNPLAMSTTETEAAAEPETFEFQAEVGRVMDIIINSLYSDKDVFLRELTSNAADACDKKRFLSITSSEDDADMPKPEIKIKADKEANTLTIEDSGVGMTKDELMNNLGRIAQSGTKNFMEALGKGTADVNLIGQFGVGFYSGYLVADKVTVITKSMQADDSPQFKWESQADSKFTIADDSANPDQIQGSGTRLILHLKDDAAEYLEASKIENLLQRYSEFIEFPISVYKETTEYEQVPDLDAELVEGEEPKMKTVPVTKEGYELMNSQKPIWTRSPKEVTEDEYVDFYKSAFRASYDEPMKYNHFVLEGQVECKAIIYVPGMLPFELSKDMFDENSRNIRLYVKRVFINDKFEDLMPRWLKFVRGVVDSDDLPLNVGREILQKSKVLNIINKRLVRKSLDMFRDIAEDEDDTKYINFWNNFGKYLKVGVIEDDKNVKELKPLLRFFSSRSGEEYTSLDSYVEGMAEGQKSIYYVTGDGKKNTAMSPVIEKLTSRGYEVLYGVEPLDEITLETLKNYKDFDIVDATKEGLNLEDDEKDEDKEKKQEDLKKEYAELVEFLEGEFAGKIQKVTLSTLLTTSPAALVQGAYGMSPTMQRYMKAQAVASGADGNAAAGMNQAVLEINPTHPIVQDLNMMLKGGDKDAVSTKNFANLMYDVASMTSGYDVPDMQDFAARVMGLMTNVAQSDTGVTDAEVIATPDVEDEVIATPDVEVIE
uniref:Histidine kinase/HSP90-like ATPase domain-containing protein n=1 Tax=Attheya septentrionalis TaxID=420275 RepID=A0A7S2XU67_9STRA|mmetsp:Transcript_29348/g.53737  ORF Transcript_29348/g.53737 Transcript_29348/m.53737 type:complete len:761 (+) Transcript_29348:16-2298(+)